MEGPGQQHLTLYDARDAAVFSSAEYLARLDDPTPLTRSVVATFRRPHRAVLEVLFSHGAATGRLLAVHRLMATDTARLRLWVEDELAPAVLTEPLVCGLHLAVTDRAATAAKSATTEGRGAAEQTQEFCALLIDGIGSVGDLAGRVAEMCTAAAFADDAEEPSVYEHVVSLLPPG